MLPLLLMVCNLHVITYNYLHVILYYTLYLDTESSTVSSKGTRGKRNVTPVINGV